MEPNLFKYVWRHSWRDQIAILIVVVIAQVFYFVSLDLPKRIVNDAIQGRAFENSQTATFLAISLPLPESWGGPIAIFDGFPLPRLDYLVALCFLYLFFVVLNGALKQRVNTEKGRLGERKLRRLRFSLFDRVLRFPILQFRKVKPAEIATMIKDEVEPLGGFIGDAFIAPAFLGGTALTALYFIFSQSWQLGLITIAMLGIQLAIIPRLRVKVLRLGKERQLTARQLAGRIAECVDGATEIHVHDTSNFERADIVHRLARIFVIRFELYQRKFLVKYLNNMLAQTTPFLFFLIGGYLALTGKFDVGALIAVISAYKDLPSPIKELIDWDQQRQDVQIKYEQVMEQFSPEDLMAEDEQGIAPEGEAALTPASLRVERLGYTDESGVRHLEDLSFVLEPGRHLAVIGGNNCGKDFLPALIARLLRPSGGQIFYGDRDIRALPERLTGRHFAYVGEESYFFPFSLKTNLIYALQHRPERAPQRDGAALDNYKKQMAEARRTGNPEFDIEADWRDLAGAGLADAAALDRRIGELLERLELAEDVYQFGLRGRIDPMADPDLAKAFMAARAGLAKRLTAPELAGLIDPFRPDTYNRSLTVAENILFGTARQAAYQPENLAANPYMAQLLEDSGLSGDLFDLGRRIAATMIELFADLPAGHPFFEQFSFIAAEDLPLYEQWLSQIERAGANALDEAARGRLIGLSFPYIESRHRLGLLDAALEDRLLGARRAFAAGLPAEDREAVEFYAPDRYNAAATVQDNILFGRLVYGQAQAGQKIGAVLADCVQSLGLRERIIGVGLDYHVGAAGKKLTTAQRQKAALLRALLKRPQLLIIGNALGLFDAATQARLLAALRAEMREGSLLLVANNAALARDCDAVLVLAEGRLAEAGSPRDLDRPESAYRALLGASAA